MSEKLPAEEKLPDENELRKLMDDGIELKRQDEADPVRGPIVLLARRVFREAVLGGNKKFVEEFETFRNSFSNQFANPEEARRYRLYHYLIGSTPPGTADLFDSEGEGSLAEGVRKLAEKIPHQR